MSATHGARAILKMTMRSLPGQKQTTPEAAPSDAIARRFERRVRLSQTAILGERMWEALLWPFVVLALFLIVSLFDIWPLLPPLAHRALLAAFGLALLAAFVPLIRLVPPTRAEALRRLEQNAGIKHRPASSYEDKLSINPRGDTATLWAAHRERLGKLVSKLKPAWPAPRTDRKDPFALRAALMLLLIVAALAAGADRWTRLSQAFTPSPASATAPLRLDAWVTPPVYTGLPPIVLADGSEPVGAGSETFRALSVPERSQLIVRAYSPHGESVKLLSQAGEGAEPKLVAPKSTNSQGLIEFNVALDEPGSADIEVGGHTVAKWRFDLINDEEPRIALLGEPTTTPRGALRLTYRASDDHGVASAEARFALADDTEIETLPQPAGPDGKAAPDRLRQPPAMPIQLPKANQKQVEGKATQDLTAHPWAGLKVRMTLAARDQAGQTGTSQAYEFILPERKFTKPLAKAVVEQRKKLVRERDAIDKVAMALDALAIGGEKAIDDSAIYLGLRDAYWRLQHDTSPDGVASVVDQLWALALKIEDGDLPEAERDVKQAQDKLSEALKENASPEEIQKLVDDLRQALSRYLQTLAKQAQDKGNMPPKQKQDGDELVSEQDLDKLLNNIEKLAKSGSKDLAEQMLSELKDILDRMQTGNFADSAKQQRAAKAMKDMNELVQKQQKLLDETFGAKRKETPREGEDFKISPPGSPLSFGNGVFMDPFGGEQSDAQGGESTEGNDSNQGKSGGRGNQQGQEGREPRKGEFGDLGQRQGELRDQLQSLMDRLRIDGASTPKQFDDAGQAMEEAKKSLGEKDLESATQQQSQALDQLRQGAQQMAEQMMENGEGQPGQGQSNNNGRDPLGRPDRTNRPDLGLSVKVPDEIDIQRAREVLDEVRRRLGEPQRPMIELDYLERLIRSY